MYLYVVCVDLQRQGFSRVNQVDSHARLLRGWLPSPALLAVCLPATTPRWFATARLTGPLHSLLAVSLPMARARRIVPRHRCRRRRPSRLPRTRGHHAAYAEDRRPPRRLAASPPRRLAADRPPPRRRLILVLVPPRRRPVLVLRWRSETASVTRGWG